MAVMKDLQRQTEPLTKNEKKKKHHKTKQFLPSMKRKRELE